MKELNMSTEMKTDFLNKPQNRREALGTAGKLGVMAAGATAFAHVFGPVFRAAPLGAQTAAPTVTEVLQYALTLEYLEFEFYQRGLNAVGLIPASDLRIFTTIRDHELAHVRFLENVLGVAADSRKPNFDFTAGGLFPNVFSDYGTFRALAQGFEDTGVRAYKGQAPNLMSNDLALTAALQIHSVEGRHASEVRRLNGNFQEQAPQKGWITGRSTAGVVPEMVDGKPVGAAIYGPGTPPEMFPAEDNVVQGGVDLTTLTYMPNLSGDRSLIITEAFDEPLGMDTVLTIAGYFIQS